MGKWSLHICTDCQSVYKDYFCFECKAYPKDDCRKHHKHFDFKRLSSLAKLKRGIDVR